MGRFIWAQGHSKQGSDKMHAIAHDWFSKDAAEPSRQALHDLKKEYFVPSADSRDGSPRHKGRSRSNTVNSSLSLYARSLSDVSNEHSSRPGSRQSLAGTTRSPSDRTESTAKNLISRGTRMLKRQGSMLNLLPLQSEPARGDNREDHVSTHRLFAGSPKRKSSARAHLTTSNGEMPGPDLKKAISSPFDFQHLTHADQAQFQRLNTATKTQLVSEFHAIRSEQQAEDVVRGIPTSDLPIATSQSEVIVEEPFAPRTTDVPTLPTTPTRPLPPPKDGLLSPFSPPEFRMSRSMENFSRPTRLSIIASDLNPHHDLSQLSFMNPINRNSIIGKPLPLVPDAVHAVSTRDDIALPLRTIPLPSPPKLVTEVIPEEEEDKTILISVHSPVAPQPMSLRGAQSPSANQVSPNMRRISQSSDEMRFDRAYDNVMSMVTADDIPSTPVSPGPQGANSEESLSLGVQQADMESWEDAIDYSWDHPTDDDHFPESGSGKPINAAPHSLGRLPQDRFLLIEQATTEDASSSASTPLMMQATTKAPLTRLGLVPSASFDEPASPLLGLGIDALTTFPSVSPPQKMTSVVDGHDMAVEAASDYRRSPKSTMSKSSSQESIILSIASSIAGTHRSSNSSTSLSDFAHLANFGDAMDKLDTESTSIAPVDEVERISKETIRDSSQTSPSTPASQPDECTEGASAPCGIEEMWSGSRITIPDRKSSISAGDATKAMGGRRRANTGSSRPRRNTRVSYSLFPTTTST
ncbi:hypothetical protein PV10_05670 [Exophiala mesophila]|uniref:CRIB domain-containing protein n=1 Tax=Exophiala mesophila TaxID=212818 RepID=A0A0D1ZWC8_EXOME|nr:uncharacterized protein PV10_05670 [Exophiala mesophila]KIV91088.1 hypothetical protein PV10_05670 [Exophiala mesophila]